MRSLLSFWPLLVCVAILLAAAVSDLRTRRIPNVLVLALMVTGLAWALWSQPFPYSVWYAFGGFGLGLLLWLPFYALGWLGAGDVKMFAAAAMWLGPYGALMASVFSAAAGGVLAILWLLWARGARQTAERAALAVTNPSLLASMTEARPGKPVLPYGVALAAGVIIRLAAMVWPLQ